MQLKKAATKTFTLACDTCGEDFQSSENRVLLGYYTASSGHSLLTFQDNLLLPLSWVKIHRLSQNVGKDFRIRHPHCVCKTDKQERNSL